MIKRQLLTLVCALGLTSLCLAQQMAEHTVYFDYGKHDLQEQYKTSLDSVLLSLPANLEDYRIELIGHTDSDGDKDFNQALSENRCNTVRSHLLSRSIDDGQIIALEGKNYTDSVATNATEQGKALNRRVEILFQWDSELPPPHHGHLGTPVAGLGDYLLSNPLAGMGAPTTSVTFRPEDGVEFTYDRSGTVVKIPADMLVYANGQPVVGEVQVDYIEWRDAVDFIGANIPMTYGKNGDIFNSAGMFEIKVTQGDQNVYVKNGGYYDIDFQLANDTLSNPDFFQYDPYLNNWSTLGDLDQRSVSFMTRQRNQCDRPFNVAMPQVEDSTKTMLNAMRIGYDLATTPNLIFEYARGNFLNMEERWESHEYVRGDYMPHIDWELEENDTAVWVPIVTRCYTEINTRKRQGNVTTLIMAEDILFHIEPSKGYNDFLSIRALQDYDWAIFPKGTEVSYDDLENEELMKSQYWTDARMEYVGEGAFDFTFKSPTDFQTVRLYLKTGGNEKQIDRKCRAIETEYKEALEVERAKIDGKNNMAKEYWSYFLNYSKYFMQGSESCLSLNKWVIYFEENRDIMQTRYEQLSTCTGSCDLWNYARNRTLPPPPPVFVDDSNVQSLRLSGFGVFNCDQLQRLGNTVEMFASYETTDGKEISPMMLYVVDYNINGVLSFSPSVVKMNHKSKTALLVIDRRQNYYLMTSYKVAEIQEKAPIEQNFQMEDITAQVTSPNGLRSVLGLKAL